MKIFIALGITALFIGALTLGRVTEEDIQLCVDSSNMSYETCKFQLGR